MKKIFILSLIISNYFIAQSQNVGIGTTTPTTKLHIKGSADTSQLTIDANATQSNNHPLIRLRNAAGQDLLHIHADDTSNIFIGLSAGKNNNANNTSGVGINNTFIGMNTGYSNTTGHNNTANGYQSLYSNTIGSNNTASGTSALEHNTTGGGNTANGTYALRVNTTGNFNTANGSLALNYNTTGSYNTANGYYSLYSNSTGSYNTVNGYLSLYYNTTGSYNTANGEGALYSNTTGYYNTANGVSSLVNNTTGNNNTANGYQSLYSNTTGSYNTAIGMYALKSAITADYNTALGYYAGANYVNGYNNVFLGANTDVNGTGYYNVIAIGQGTICTGPSQVTMGNGATGAYRAYANWSNISDGRYKKNVQENVPGLAFINKLRPVTYNLAATSLDEFLHKDSKNEMSEAGKKIYEYGLKEKEKITYTGFVAQEVEAAAKDIGFDFSGVDKPKNENDTYGLRYAEFVVPLVKAVQEQQLIIQKLQMQVEADKAEIPMQIGKQQQLISGMEKRIKLLEEQNKMLLELLNKKN